jgi:hypothetical protein
VDGNDDIPVLDDLAKYVECNDGDMKQNDDDDDDVC